MACIRDQRQRATEYAPCDTHQHGHHRNAQCPGKPLVRSVCGVVVMVVIVAVSVRRVVVMIVRVGMRHGEQSQGRAKPALRSSLAVAISGRPMSAVGSRDCTSAVSVMPNPSIFAEPAQS